MNKPEDKPKITADRGTPMPAHTQNVQNLVAFIIQNNGGARMGTLLRIMNDAARVLAETIPGEEGDEDD